MKSKDQSGSEDISADERKYLLASRWYMVSSWYLIVDIQYIPFPLPFSQPREYL